MADEESKETQGHENAEQKEAEAKQADTASTEAKSDCAKDDEKSISSESESATQNIRVDDPNSPKVPQRQSLILKAVLEDTPPPAEAENKKQLRYPVAADVVLALGLLIAVGGFVIGMFKMYAYHHAQQCVAQGNYRGAIAILKGNPLTSCFNTDADEGAELLNQALYMDAMDRMEKTGDINGALSQLQQVKAGSHYFTLAQEILTDNFSPAQTQLQGGVETHQALEKAVSRN